jgi:hypothetical protein
MTVALLSAFLALLRYRLDDLRLVGESISFVRPYKGLHIAYSIEVVSE